ncbi:PHB depolymerase family esterase [Rugosimonospora acidiphila]|uniref:PHB depolymerase family esterase n=1 Tax=Rugosimonospora acidiphila TaxID=556531 RepID=A0ABP9S7F6_9ACTN
MRRHHQLLVAAVACAGALAVAAATPRLAAPAQAAATLTQVSGFGSNPGALGMYSYVPTGLASGAPLVVALHGCTQSASDYYTNAGWPKYADLYHFALVFPQQSSANNATECFNWFQTSDYARGQGEALSIKQMVDYAVAHYGSDPHRVYVTGLSAGGAMTAVMLADYPDVFAGGAIIGGIPYACASDLTSGLTCQYGATSKTPAQWGNLVRGADPGYSGPWPRVAIWYGTSDAVVNPANATESRDQWTNAWGISQTPSSTTSLPGGTTLQSYDDSSGQPAVELYGVQGIGHGTPVNPGSATDQCGATGTYYLRSICSSYYTAQFWGLGSAAPTASPTGSPSPTASASASGKPSPSPSPSPTADQPCFTGNNYQQTTAGRSHQSGGYTYANGSNQAMGLWNVFVTHTLRQTGPNYYVLADGQC